MDSGFDALGVDHVVKTPFGFRRLVYSDFTASGRALRWVATRHKTVARGFQKQMLRDVAQ